MKIVILREILSFHKYLRRKGVCPFIKSWSKDLTVNTPESLSFQTNLSDSVERFTYIKH
jgi:hypothetical protein